MVPGQPEPIAVVRKLMIEGQVSFRAVTWARKSADRVLIGYYPTGDEAAEACWRRYVDSNRARHAIAARTHGSAERGGPAANLDA